MFEDQAAIVSIARVTGFTLAGRGVRISSLTVQRAAVPSACHSGSHGQLLPVADSREGRLWASLDHPPEPGLNGPVPPWRRLSWTG